MERLTHDTLDYCDAVCKGCNKRNPETCIYAKEARVYAKLKTYEDTGLTPEEIKASRATAAIVAAVAVQDAALYDDSALARADQEIERLEKELKRYKDAEKSGRWVPVKLKRRTTEYKCSICGRWERTNKEPYCNCGAKMDGENHLALQKED